MSGSTNVGKELNTDPAYITAQVNLALTPPWEVLCLSI